jgi:glycosyltransferase involved in cell wall biosynthesis
MLEAMACGTPVAAYNAPSPLDVVEDGVTGAIDDTLDKAIARAAVLDRTRVCEGSMKFSWRTCADMFESWLVPCGRLTPGRDQGELAVLPSR